MTTASRPASNQWTVRTALAILNTSEITDKIIHGKPALAELSRHGETAVWPHSAQARCLLSAGAGNSSIDAGLPNR